MLDSSHTTFFYNNAKEEIDNSRIATFSKKAPRVILDLLIK
jgi:hypothetical protein